MSVPVRGQSQLPLNPPKPKPELKRPDETHAAESTRLMGSIGKVTRSSYLLLMETMEEKYPGRGWREYANKLEDFYDKQGLELSEKKSPTIFK